MVKFVESPAPRRPQRRQRIDWHVFARHRPLVGLRIVLPFVDGYSHAARKFDAALVRLARRVAGDDFAQRRVLDDGPACFDVAFAGRRDAERLVALVGGDPVCPPPEGWACLFLRKADPSIYRQIVALPLFSSLAGLRPSIPGANPWSQMRVDVARPPPGQAR